MPVAPSSAILLRFAAAGGLVKTLVSSPDVEVREGLNGELLAAVEYHGETTQAELAQTAQRALTSITSTFRGAENIRLQSAHIGIRPMPGDEEPIIGYVPGVRGVYVAVMHSGVTLAPIIGRLVAEEVVHGGSAVELQGCRLARFNTSAASG